MKVNQTTIISTSYTCELCKTEYASEHEAKLCEAKPITKNKGVKVGDMVTVLNGGGKGERAKVTDIFVIDKDWGHYASERYHHTVGIHVDFIDSFGSRRLTFDDYKRLKI